MKNFKRDCNFQAILNFSSDLEFFQDLGLIKDGSNHRINNNLGKNPLIGGAIEPPNRIPYRRGGLFCGRGAEAEIA